MRLYSPVTQPPVSSGGYSITSMPGKQYFGAAAGAGTTITTGAADTKGSYANIGSPVSGNALEAIRLDLHVGGNAESFRIDLIHNDGSDHTLLDDYFVDVTAAATLNFPIFLGVHVPVGGQFKMRAAADGGSGRTIFASIVGFEVGPGGLPGRTRFYGLTDFNASETLPKGSVTLTGTTPTALVELCASTQAAVDEIWFTPSRHGVGTRTSSNILTEVYIGAPGSEVKFDEFRIEQNTGGIYTAHYRSPTYIPALSRLTWKATCSAAAAELYSVAAYGRALT